MTGRHEPDESRDSRPDLWGAAAEMPPPTRQDSNRRRDFDCTSFTFLGYEFRPRESKSGGLFKTPLDVILLNGLTCGYVSYRS